MICSPGPHLSILPFISNPTATFVPSTTPYSIDRWVSTRNDVAYARSDRSTARIERGFRGSWRWSNGAFGGVFPLIAPLATSVRTLTREPRVTSSDLGGGGKNSGPQRYLSSDNLS